MATIGIDCRMYSSRFTGIGRYVYELTRNLFRLDDQNNYVLFFNDPEYDLFDPPNDRIRKVKVNVPHYSLKEQTKFNRILKRSNLDLMHFTHFNAPILYKKPSIVTIHDLTLSFYPGKKMTSFLHRMGYHIVIKNAVKNAKKIISVSENTKRDLQKLMHIPSEKIEVIYEGVDSNFRPITDETYAMAIKEKLKIDKPYLLYTGVWRSHKNLKNLINAFSILKEEYDYDGYLVITGRKDPVYAPDILSQTYSLELHGDIIFTGMVDEMELIALYGGAQVYVFPSLYEGFGLSPLEAMQCGVPVAASRSSCIPEVCGEQSALYFNPNDPANMAETIYSIISDSDLRARLIQSGLARVKNFSWQKMTEETLTLYNQTLK
ncbi:glycosyltransferase family 4 protein [Patescibacteria group bacterium]|nr:glycosyltransferase family 4 protein [Patescibacteria group bacterium]MBU1703146.1 glycosyltransferase family 4 protein [Patescibacteria group bacterium]MBU1953643.1 glycosyltransferase family 4 protein [Patescibacteria group bacterium]